MILLFGGIGVLQALRVILAEKQNIRSRPGMYTVQCILGDNTTTTKKQGILLLSSLDARKRTRDKNVVNKNVD